MVNATNKFSAFQESARVMCNQEIAKVLKGKDYSQLDLGEWSSEIGSNVVDELIKFQPNFKYGGKFSSLVPSLLLLVF